MFILAIMKENNEVNNFNKTSLFENYLTASARRRDVTARIAGAVGTTSVARTQSAGLRPAEVMGTQARDVLNSPNCSPLVALRSHSARSLTLL